MYYSIGLKEDGTIVFFGDYKSNQIYTNIITIKCGRYYSIGLKDDGTIVCWGNKNYKNIDPIYLTYTNIKFPNSEFLDFTLK